MPSWHHSRLLWGRHLEFDTPDYQQGISGGHENDRHARTKGEFF